MSARQVRSRWSNAVLVCRKCEKKIKGGGFGPEGNKSLGKALRKHLQLGKGRKAGAGILEVGCLDICPKRAVTVVDTSKPDRWLIIHPGANLDVLAHDLGLRNKS
ncbi:putative metal-binding protein [Sphingobium sp. B11D3B]|uniref:(2Fe-2S) ferredoxin domain-containing protein n=1 Tax=Sphingobium sp. B11D3B TaxID=2940575 RepID=UPI0022267641|nr:(2Fe-2S) ferredoxin domain-containing protein [Sphingobium sp. B11D3B]MCW2389818.1 putative metal-binding protein [Sphingobium sp. B11D3B]